MVGNPQRLCCQKHYIGFSAINKPSSPMYRPGFQKHHLIPLSSRRYNIFRDMFDKADLSLNNFAENGLLLPAEERIAAMARLPLHRGPHPLYSELVHQRLANIGRTAAALSASETAIRLKTMQSALRKTLINHAKRPKPLLLNRRDPMHSDMDFGHLDAAIDRLWPATAEC